MKEMRHLDAFSYTGFSFSTTFSSTNFLLHKHEYKCKLGIQIQKILRISAFVSKIIFNVELRLSFEPYYFQVTAESKTLN